MLLLKSTTLLLLSSVSAHVIQSQNARAAKPGSSITGNWCGNAQWDAPKHLMVRSGQDEVASKQAPTNSSIIIDTYVHIVTNSTKVEDGFVPVRRLCALDPTFR
jgi:hypothetical protein